MNSQISTPVVSTIASTMTAAELLHRLEAMLELTTNADGSAIADRKGEETAEAEKAASEVERAERAEMFGPLAPSVQDVCNALGETKLSKDVWQMANAVVRMGKGNLVPYDFCVRQLRGLRQRVVTFIELDERVALCEEFLAITGQPVKLPFMALDSLRKLVAAARDRKAQKDAEAHCVELEAKIERLTGKSVKHMRLTAEKLEARFAEAQAFEDARVKSARKERIAQCQKLLELLNAHHSVLGRKVETLGFDEKSASIEVINLRWKQLDSAERQAAPAAKRVNEQQARDATLRAEKLGLAKPASPALETVTAYAETVQAPAAPSKDEKLEAARRIAKATGQRMTVGHGSNPKAVDTRLNNLVKAAPVKGNGKFVSLEQWRKDNRPLAIAEKIEQAVAQGQ